MLSRFGSSGGGPAQETYTQAPTHAHVTRHAHMIRGHASGIMASRRCSDTSATPAVAASGEATLVGMRDGLLLLGDSPLPPVPCSVATFVPRGPAFRTPVLRNCCALGSPCRRIPAGDSLPAVLLCWCCCMSHTQLLMTMMTLNGHLQLQIASDSTPH